MKANLETNLVFVETQAFVAERFTFGSQPLCTLRGMARDGAITFLTTDATVRECKERIGRQAKKRLQAFDDYLRDARAVTCSFQPFPINELCDDCAAGKFPLGKKLMLKDAAPLVVLKYWCQQNAQKTYVISADEDVRNVCLANADIFLHVATIKEFL